MLIKHSKAKGELMNIQNKEEVKNNEKKDSNAPAGSAKKKENESNNHKDYRPYITAEVHPVPFFYSP